MKTLINKTLVSNQGLHMAALKVQEARAQYRLADVDRYPQSSGEDSGSWSGNLKGDPATTREFLTSPNASFDLDPFGCLKSMNETERQNYLAAEEAQHAVHILLVPNATQGYFNQRLAYAQLQIAEETLCNYQQSYAFVEKQLLTGSSNVLALE